MLFKNLTQEDAQIFLNKFISLKEKKSPELKFMEHIINSGFETFSTPYSVSWEITAGCNLRCKHCCFANDSYDNKQDVSSDVAINFAQQLVENDLIKIMVTGGEPLLREDLFDIISVLKSKNAIIELTTNATLINEEKAKKLSKLLNPTYDYIQVSLDGADAQTHEKTRGAGTFQKTIDGIKLLLKHNLFVTINCVITTLNLHQMCELYDLAESLGIKLITFSRIHSDDEELVPNKDILFEEMIKVLKKENSNLKIDLRLFNFPEIASNPLLGENLPKSFSKIINFSCNRQEKIHIRKDGEVFLCLYASTKNILPLGNIKNNSLEELIQNMQTNPLFQTRIIKNSKCNTCAVQYYCKGGCPVNAYIQSNTINAMDSSCKY